MTWTFQRHDNSSATKPKTHTHTEKEKHTNHKIRHKRINTHNTETFFVVLYEGHTVHTLCFFALFRCCALERSLSRPRHDRARRQPRRAGEKPLLSHTHIHTHTHTQTLFRQFSLSPPTLPLLSLCVLLVVVVVVVVVVIALVPFAASLACARPRSRRR